MRRILALFALAMVVSVTAGIVLRPAARPAAAQTGTTVVVQRAKASYAQNASERRVLSILAIGSDFRPGGDACECADSLHLITVNPQKRAGTIVGFPRDSYVDIPGFGRNKINTALQRGGPELVVRAVEQLTNIHIDYFLLTDFEGFSRMVDGIGGLVIDVPYAMSDPYSGAYFTPGKHRMKGGHALSFARNRHGAPGGDLGRSHNQGLVLLAALERLREVFAHDPAQLVSWIALGVKHMQTNLSLGELTRLALAAARTRPSAIRNLLVPATIGTAGAQSVVYITPAADGLFRDLKDDGIVNS
jgi:LCP family protein required for cell wall assembly